MTDKPHTPNTDEVLQGYVASTFSAGISALEAYERADRWLANMEAAAEQRGAERAFRKTQEIIAGFDHTIDEARERDDMINTGHLITELDAEIQDLMEGDND